MPTKNPVLRRFSYLRKDYVDRFDRSLNSFKIIFEGDVSGWKHIKSNVIGAVAKFSKSTLSPIKICDRGVVAQDATA